MNRTRSYPPARRAPANARGRLACAAMLAAFALGSTAAGAEERGAAPYARLTSVSVSAGGSPVADQEFPQLVDPGGASPSSSPKNFVIDQSEQTRHEAKLQAAASAHSRRASAAATHVAAGRATPAVLPWGPTVPSTEMAAVAERAEETVRAGFSLAERAALYTARSQFVEALRTLAEAMDAQRGTQAHCKALSAGLTALKEVDDFVPSAGQLEADLNLKHTIAAHETPILKRRPIDDMTLLEAKRAYLTYAQEQLAAAAGDQPVASLALHGLGRVCTAPAALHGPRDQLAEGKAVVLFQAALVVAPENFMAANELGVLLSKFGRLDEAQTALEHAASLSNSPTAWRNLAVVCQRRGNADRAAQARRQADLVVAQLQQAGQPGASSNYTVEWVEPDDFAQSHSALVHHSPAAGQSSTAPAGPFPSNTAAAQAAAQSAQKSGGWKWPWQ